MDVLSGSMIFCIPMMVGINIFKWKSTNSTIAVFWIAVVLWMFLAYREFCPSIEQWWPLRTALINSVTCVATCLFIAKANRGKGG